jgi:DedD protein
MDSHAKQRLTGAVILVAVFVLLVPELLTGPKNAATPATAEEEGLRRYTIDLNAPAAPVGQEPSGPAMALPPVDTPMTGDNPRAQPGEAASAEPGAVEPAPSQPVAAVQAPAQSSPKPPVTPTESARATSPAPAPAAAPPPRESPAPAAGAGTFVVQLGSFGSRENAERLVRDMTARGFTTFIAPTTTNGRALYRVRVGPTRDRASAEALATQLKRMGQSGSIVPIS